MARTEFSRKTRRLAWERANGMCEGMIDDHWHSGGLWLDGGKAIWYPPGMLQKRCNFPIDLGLFHYDHIVPDWTGGDNTLANCAVLCRLCHAKKTAEDVGAIAKVKRIRDRRSKSLTSKRPMPFGRESKFKKRMDGTIVRRA